MADLRIIRRKTSDETKEVLIEVDPTNAAGSGPNDETFSVQGRISNGDDSPAPGLQVRAYDKGLDQEVLLGEVASSTEGEYIIYYNTSQLIAGKLRADLIVKVFDTAQNPEALLAETPIIVNADPQEIADLTIDNFSEDIEIAGPSEYKILKDAIDPYLAGVNIENMDLQGVAVVASKIEVSAENTTDFIKARYLSPTLSVSEEILYGLFRFDLPYEKAELLKTAEKDLREALQATALSNIISPSIADDIDTPVQTLLSQAVDTAFEDEDAPDQKTDSARVLETTGLDMTRQRAFMEIAIKDEETAAEVADFWGNLVSQEGFTQQEADNLRFTTQLAAITQNYAPMISAIKARPDVNGIEDLSQLEYTDWMSLIDQPGVGVPNIDEVDVTTEQKETYANALLQAVETAFSTGVFKKSLASEPTQTDAYNFLEANPDYDILKTSPNKYFEENPNPDENLKAKIKSNKRLFHITRGPVKKTMLLELENKTFDSAQKIARVGRRRFVKRNADLPGAEKEAAAVYRKASRRNAATMMLHAKYNPDLNDIATAAFDKTPLANTDPTTVPELSSLFGSQGFCSSEHCQSALSPAAYLVDLITFLRDFDASTGTTTAWQQLQARRPELENIQLSCENTNTVMPYIDLVNEILENAVLGQISQTADNSRQTTQDTATLKANPEHISIAAYDELASKSYPWSLPFNLWNEESAAYLEKKDIHRSEIISALARTLSGTNKTAQAAVYLGISQPLLDIITGTNSPADTDLAYFNTNTDLNKVDVLLEKSGLAYEVLTEILQTDFVNPTNIEVVFADGSCQLEQATLAFNAADRNRLQQFARLKTVLEWPVKTLDMAITSLGAGAIDTAFIEKLAGVHQLSKQIRTDVDSMLPWYSALSTKQYGDQSSQYDSIFQLPQLFTYESEGGGSSLDRFSTSSLATTPVTVIAGGELEAENGPIIMAALGLEAGDMLKLAQLELPGETANLLELSHLYRIATFTRALKITVDEFLDLKALTGLNPLNSAGASSAIDPIETSKFIDIWEELRRARFSISELNYLLRHRDEPGASFWNVDTIAQSLGALRTALQGKLADKGLIGVPQRERVANLFLLFFDETIANTSLALAEGNFENIADPNGFIDTHWASLVDAADAKSKLGTSGTLSVQSERFDYVLEAFYPEVMAAMSLKDEAITWLSNVFGVSSVYVDYLLKTHLKSPSDASTPAIELFTSLSFVNSTAPIDVAGYADQFSIMQSADKLLMVVQKLGIRIQELAFVLDQTASTGWYAIDSLPLVDVPTLTESEFSSFRNLVKAFQLNRDLISGDFSLIDLLEKINVAGLTEAEARQALADGTTWNINDIQYLTGANGFNFNTDDYKNEGWVYHIREVLSITSNLGISAEQLLSWAKDETDPAQFAIDVTSAKAKSIRLAVKAGYDSTQWLEIAPKLRDGLREKQRDALSDYMIAYSTAPTFSDRNDLYDHYLVDTEMSACGMTSRIKLAISTVQLWVHRIRMGLIPTVAFDEEDMEEWEWRKNYRVWEAARKVFLYPENWIEPELLDMKSPFLEQLEDELLQNETTAETAEAAYLNYLEKFLEVADLEVAGVFREVSETEPEEGDPNRSGTLHVFGRTKEQPHRYFHRKLEDGFNWTAWEAIEVDIEGDHLIPVVFNRRMMLFWPIFRETAEEATDSDFDVKVEGGEVTGNATPSAPKRQLEIQLARTEFSNGKWQAKKISKRGIDSSFTDQSKFFFQTTIDTEGLHIDVFFADETQGDHEGSFFLNNCSGELETKKEQTGVYPPPFLVRNTDRRGMQLVERVGNNFFGIGERIKYRLLGSGLSVPDRFEVYNQRLLNRTPGNFRIAYPIEGLNFLSDAPFFYEDERRSFFVLPSEEVYSDEFIIDPNPRITDLTDIFNGISTPKVTQLRNAQHLQRNLQITLKSNLSLATLDSSKAAIRKNPGLAKLVDAKLQSPVATVKSGPLNIGSSLNLNKTFNNITRSDVKTQSIKFGPIPRTTNLI
ncbi:MAG: neuraminidase-like domain-containing protein [Bacteroidota bacterium]